MTHDGKGWAGTVLGWFVVREDGDPASPGAGAPDAESGPAPPGVEPVGELPPAAGGLVDFDAVFAAFGIGTDAQDRLAKADGLLKTLPPGTDPVVKRQIVEASLKAFGVPFEQIIETACEDIQALDAYQRKGAEALKAFCDDADRRIAALRREIDSIQSRMEARAADQRSILESCNRKKLEIQRVLEFFGPEVVGNVVRSSPKLVDPSAPGAAVRPPAK